MAGRIDGFADARDFGSRTGRGLVMDDADCFDFPISVGP